MKNRIVYAILAAAFMVLTVAPASSAVDLADVGYIDQAAIGSLPAFQSANAQLQSYQDQLKAQFESQLKNLHTDADKQRVSMQFDQEFTDKKNEVLGPLYQRAQLAIAQAASNHNLSIVVDKRVVVYGGVDISREVIGLLNSNAAIAPPSSTPPTSEIGFVDQTVLDDLPKVKDASDQLTKFTATERDSLRSKYQAAKTDADRKAVADEYQKAVSDKQDQLLKPLVDQTKSVTADVAKKKNLLLVIDRGDVIYGGTDITKDVQDALSK